MLAAFDRAAGQPYTDEAALLEAAGTTVVTVPGEQTNIKVTDQADLEIVRALAGARARGTTDERIGWGEDSHPFGPEMGLMLGGIEITNSPRLYGHSDGDVVLHALATAILSACGLGDLGRLFPPTDPRTKGIASAELVSSMPCARPQTKAGKSTVRRSRSSAPGRKSVVEGWTRWLLESARLVGSEAGSVSVVASTGNLSGDAGAGRVIRATALVTVVRR